MRMGVKAIVASALLAVAVWALPAGAMVPAMTLNEIADASQTIVRGNVVSLVPHWNEAHTTIYTTVTIEPIEYMKGEQGGGQVVFDVPGGVVGDVGLSVSDVPEFAVGEDVVVFLRPEYFQVVGWRQGVLKVQDGMVQGADMSLTQFRAHIARLSGVSLEEEETIGSDGTVIRPATMTAPDFLGEAGPAAPEAGVPSGARMPNVEVSIMTEDFEGTFPTGSWLLADAGATGHEWGKETYRKNGGTYSMWECASGGSALPSGSDYANNMQTWARFGPFDLSDATSAELRFYRSVQTEGSGDYLFYASSANGSNFSGYNVSGGIGSWTYTILDLASLLGDDSAYIAFMFVSDGSLTDKGVFIDDVELVKTTADPTSPVIDSISPDTGASGAHLSVTITGSNFGATQGASAVQFTRDPMGTPTVDADNITSWSDTQIICEVPEYASSGDAHVLVSGDPGVGKAFTVTYGASKVRWIASEPMGEDMLINPNCADAPGPDVLAACIKGFQEWNAESGSDFSFTYGGPTGATGEGWTLMNEIAWGSTGGSLATNYSWFNTSPPYGMLENDIIFDDVWDWSTDGEPGKYDIQSVMTHELGHCMRFLDLYGTADIGKTMYGRISAGQTTARTIEDAEKNGMDYFYGAQSLNITTRELPDAVAPVLYSASISATGGTAPRTFALRSGSVMPDGLSLSSGGMVSGYPRESGTFYLNVRVTDSALETDSQVIKLYIDAAAPVTMERFAATPVDEGILVEWSVSDDSDPGEFYVHRSVADRFGGYEVLGDGPVPASEGPGRSYAFLDKDVIDGTLYFYKLESSGVGGDVFFGPVSALASLGAPSAFWLGQNRPNPFSPTRDGVTVVTFSVPAPTHATVRIYDVAGRLVAVPLDRNVGAGETDVVWDGVDVNGRTVPSGVYFYDLSTGGTHAGRKMSLAR
jgi:hypothetical protein